MRRVLIAAAVAVVAAATVGLLVNAEDEDELRRVGLPTLDETVATVLEDSTPVFVTRDPADEVQVIDARTPPRSVPEGAAALPDLVEGLVAWCAKGGFVDDLAPSATFAFDGRATGPTEAGLGVYAIAERARAHVMVGDARPPAGADSADSAERARPDELVAECEDPELTDDHGQAMHETEVDAIRAGPSWVVEAAVDLGAGVLCDPPGDPLAWPLCPDGGVPVALPDRRPAPELVEEHGPSYAERDAFGFVGRFLVRREEDDAPLRDVWRLPYQVTARAQPREHHVEARLRLGAEGAGEDSAADPASTVTGDPPLATVTVDDADGDVPDRLPLEPVTELVADDALLTGEEAVTALGEALEADPDARWQLRVRHDPLRPPRLERVERLEQTDEPAE